MSRHIAWIALLVAGAAPAAEFTPPADLPPIEVVGAVLDDHPVVREAEARLRVAGAERDALDAGPHELELRVAGQRRDIAGVADRSDEWAAGIERGFRLFGKAGLDADIGARGVDEAREKVGDARHETARHLLGLWYEALRALTETRLRTSQASLLEEVRGTVAARNRRGDAARLELLEADAALAQARSQKQQALGRQQAALAGLRASFPSLPPATPRAAEPVLPAGTEAEWTAATLEHNHELLAVQSALEGSRLAARRASRDRLPDPTLGLFYANEQFGDEKIVGMSLAVPIGIGARSAEADRRRGQADALAELETATRRRLEAEAVVNWERAATGIETWRQLRDASAAMTRHADLARRAYELGEMPLAESLLARRNAAEAEVAAEQARLDANEAIARLLLDSHRMWSTHDDDEPHGG
ncbi:hypothetical protein GPROT2_00828 [Gammaproteobacteria bacterium]|nr:TolC family protein [Gammaproteobacteria bacterium]QOJ32616.1 MAG: TolC family protein [Gammaproteobacteria bacterium]CAG0940003.1 hypothetical protein GPROT2_00828 [Gammaproteobacteria bacterium]